MMRARDALALVRSGGAGDAVKRFLRGDFIKKG